MAYKNIPVVIVAAMGRTTRVIGNNNELLWHIPEDLKRFKELTVGKPVIMGRATFESILAILDKPLPNRTNVVLTRDTSYAHDGVIVTHALEEALEVAANESPTEIHIGGGAQIYELALPYVDRIYATLVDDELEGDTFFPDFQNEFSVIKEYPMMEHNGIPYQWVDYERRS